MLYVNLHMNLHTQANGSDAISTDINDSMVSLYFGLIFVNIVCVYKANLVMCSQSEHIFLHAYTILVRGCEVYITFLLHNVSLV